MASKTVNPFTFLQQVRSETTKVTWPSRRETMISTIMVVVFAFLAAIFFFTADRTGATGDVTRPKGCARESPMSRLASLCRALCAPLRRARALDALC